jgi:hypothetical protein
MNLSLSISCITDKSGHRSVLVGEVDEEAEKAVDLSSIRAEQMPPIRHG